MYIHVNLFNATPKKWHCKNYAKKVLTGLHGSLQNTAAYHILGNFRILLFSWILQILLSREIKIRKSIAMPHLSIAHVDHLRKYFSWNYQNRHFCENLATQKFPGIRYNTAVGHFSLCTVATNTSIIITKYLRNTCINEANSIILTQQIECKHAVKYCKWPQSIN